MNAITGFQVLTTLIGLGLVYVVVRTYFATRDRGTEKEAALQRWRLTVIGAFVGALISFGMGVLAVYVGAPMWLPLLLYGFGMASGIVLGIAMIVVFWRGP